MKRFEVVFNIPSPYRLHMLDAMWRDLRRRGIDFHVHFMARFHSERPKSWRNPSISFPHTFWRDYGFGTRHFNPGLVWHIMRNPPEWLLAGSPYDTFTCILILFLAKVPVKIVGAEGNTKTTGRLDGLIGWFKRAVYSQAKFASVPGQDAVRYFELHQNRSKLHMPVPVIIPNLVDERRFRPRATWAKEQIDAMRAELGATPKTRLCIVPARLEPVKGLLPFIKQLSPAMLQGWHISILGQGSLKTDILHAISKSGLESMMSIHDYMPYDKMPLCYASADLLLLPSLYDPNPLSVPEALFSALPIALSDQAGNVEEGVDDGKNGWRLPVNDGAGYYRVLEDIFSSSKERLEEMGRRSLNENAKFWDTEKSVKRYIDVIVGSGKEC